MSLRAVRSLMRAPDADAENLIEAARVLGRRGGIHWSDGLYQLQMFALAYQRGALVGERTRAAPRPRTTRRSRPDSPSTR